LDSAITLDVIQSPAYVILTRRGEHQQNAFFNLKSNDSKAAVTLSPAAVILRPAAVILSGSDSYRNEV